MRNKRIVFAILAGTVMASMLGCHSQTNDTTSDASPLIEKNAVMVRPMYGYTMQECGGRLSYRHPDGGMTILSNRQGEWETSTVLDDVIIDHVDNWNDDLIYRAVDDESYEWYVYDFETDTSTALQLSDSAAAKEALQDVSGICVIGDGLYIIHSYWRGISRIDLVTGAYGIFDADVWSGYVPCAADASSFYVPGTRGMEVFDLKSCKRAAYDWSENEKWLGSANLNSALLTEGNRMYLHIAREDAMVPEELKRVVFYVDTNGDLSELVSVTDLGGLPAYSVTRVYGEYGGTLVLTDGDVLYAYDTENNTITELCAMPKTNVFCEGGYVLTPSENGTDLSVIAQIPASVS